MCLSGKSQSAGPLERNDSFQRRPDRRACSEIRGSRHGFRERRKATTSRLSAASRETPGRYAFVYRPLSHNWPQGAFTRPSPRGPCRWRRTLPAVLSPTAIGWRGSGPWGACVSLVQCRAYNRWRGGLCGWERQVRTCPGMETPGPSESGGGPGAVWFQASGVADAVGVSLRKI